MEFDTLPEFEKDLKQLLKSYRTLKEDLSEIKTILKKKPNERPPFSFQIADLGLKTCIIKVKKLACKAIKGRGVNSGLRLIYAWFEIEQKITFVELYHKSDKEIEDRVRIVQNFH